MKRFKTLYLHIGLGKTGTTSIQEDLLARAQTLEAQYDLHYPVDFPHEEHFFGNHSIPLRVLFSSQDNVRRRLAARGLVSDADIEAYNRQTRVCLDRSFDRSRAGRVLLSAEGVGHFSRGDLPRLACWLQTFAEEIKVVACLRHPALALSSEIQQRLYIGDTLEQLYLKPPVYSFRSLFNRIEAAFGEGSLLVYDFAEAVQHPRGVTSALLGQLGIASGELFAKQPATNTSMSHEAALLISALNRCRPVLVDGRPNPERPDGAVQRIMAIPGRKFTAPAEVYTRVADSVKSDLDWLQSHCQLQLRAEYPRSDWGHDSFSQESIDALALQLAESAEPGHQGVSPLQSALRSARTRLQRLR